MYKLIPILMLCSLPLAAQKDSDVRGALESWKAAMLKQDRAALDKLYSPDLTYTHSSGKTESKGEAIEAVLAAGGAPSSIEFEGMTVRMYGNTAVVKSKVIMRSSQGQPTMLDVLFVWVKQRGGWQMVARHALRLTS